MPLFQRLCRLTLIGGLLAACGTATPTPAPLPSAAAVPTAAAGSPQTLTATVPHGTSASPSPDVAPPATSTPAAAATQPAPASAAPTPPLPPTVARPAWQHLPLVDARTGTTFTLADFEGKTVYVEPMATWCANCRQQLTVVREVQPTLADPAVVFVALSVETTLSASELAAYADQAGFDWTFAVITPELLRELTAVFGRTITNPPATPHFLIRPDGTTTELTTGIDSAESLRAMVESAGATTP